MNEQQRSACQMALLSTGARINTIQGQLQRARAGTRINELRDELHAEQVVYHALRDALKD